MGMKALVEEAAANSGGSAGAGKDWGHEEIMWFREQRRSHLQ